MAGAIGTNVIKDGNGAAIVGGVRMFDVSGTGVGPWVPVSYLYDPVSGALGTIKPASTAPVATDTSVVVGLNPNSIQMGAGATTATTPRVALANDTVNQNVGNNVDAVAAAALAAAPVVNYGYGFNGTTWDRLQVDASKNLKVVAAAAISGGVSRSRTLIPNNTTAVVVKSGAGQLYKIRATNNSGTIAYIKLYDATSATVGVGTPVDTIMIPANSSGGAGIVDTTDLGAVHTTGITYIVTTGIADNDIVAPAASTYIVTLYYK